MRSGRLSFNIEAIKLLVCASLMLILHGVNAPIDACTKSEGNLIRVWTVGSPHTGELPQAVVPPELQRQAEVLGYKITVETFRASGFAEKFRQALQEQNEPEILTFDNYGVLRGIRTSLGWFDGISSDSRTAPSLMWVHEALVSLQPVGWVMLVSSAVNYDAARALALQSPVCDSKFSVHGSTIEPALQSAKEAATLATRAYLACDRSTVSDFSDPTRLGKQCFLPESETEVREVKACQASGNRNLAFVTLVSNFSAKVVRFNYDGLVHKGNLGKQSILAVLRNHGNSWRLLAITDDPVNTVARSKMTRPDFEHLLGNGESPGITTEPAQLMTADGEFPRPIKGQRFGDFWWEPSRSTDVVAQVIEFTWGSEKNMGRTRLFFLAPAERKLSSGYLVRGIRNVWRVWTVSKSGDVVFSEQHSYLQ